MARLIRLSKPKGFVGFSPLHRARQIAQLIFCCGQALIGWCRYLEEPDFRYVSQPEVDVQNHARPTKAANGALPHSSGGLRAL
jgi:hypothetical protein